MSMVMRRAALGVLLAAGWTCSSSAHAQTEPLEPGFWINGEYLNWTVRQDNTPYTGIITSPTAPINNLVNSIAGIDNDYRPTSGFRVGGGWRFCTGMDISVDYTRFRSRAQSGIGAPDADAANDNVYAALLDRGFNDPLFSVAARTSQGIVDQAQQDRQVQLDVFDAMVGYTAPLGDYFGMRFSGGARFARLDESVNTVYQNLVTDGIDTFTEKATILQDIQMRGVGPRAALEAGFLLGDTGLSLFGGAGFSLLFATFDSRRSDEHVTGVAGDIGLRQYNVDATSVVPVFDLKVGVRWDCGPLFVAGGYDVSAWLNVRRHPDTDSTDGVDDTSIYRLQNGNISFDGWSAMVGLRY